MNFKLDPLFPTTEKYMLCAFATKRWTNKQTWTLQPRKKPLYAVKLYSWLPVKGPSYKQWYRDTGSGWLARTAWRWLPKVRRWIYCRQVSVMHEMNHAYSSQKLVPLLLTAQQWSLKVASQCVHCAALLHEAAWSPIHYSQIIITPTGVVFYQIPFEILI